MVDRASTVDSISMPWLLMIIQHVLVCDPMINISSDMSCFVNKYKPCGWRQVVVGTTSKDVFCESLDIFSFNM